MIDQTGKTVSLPDNPRRVVSLAPNITEMIFALGAQEALVGRSQFSNYPPEALRLPQVGSYYRPDVERIVSLRPDLCLAVRDGAPVAILEQLETMGIPVVTLDPQSLDSLKETLTLLGNLFDRRPEAAKLTAAMDERLRMLDARVEQALRRTGRRPVVLLQVQASPLMACARGSYPGELIVRAGGDNPLHGDAPYPRLSPEALLSLRPDVILAPGASGKESGNADSHGADAETSFALYRKPPLSRILPAALSGRLYSLPADVLFRASPRSLDALEMMVDLFFPENGVSVVDAPENQKAAL